METVADLQRRLDEYETLLEIGVELAGTLDLRKVLDLALRKAEELCRAETSSIWELDEESQELFFHLVRGKAAWEIRDLRVPVGHGIVGSVAASGKPEVVNDVAKEPRWGGDEGRGFQTRAILTVPLLAHGKVIGVLQLLNPIGKHCFDDDDLRRMQLFAGSLANAVENARLYAAQKRLFVDTVTALAEAVAKRDPYTGGHIRRVVGYSLLLAEEMGLELEEIEELRLAATLHDIGKVGVPEEILQKPAPLSADETRIMQRHPVDGAEIVSNIRDLRALLPGVRSHHERLDGLGYPDGLTDSQIPTVARIIAVADTYDAITTDRPYRRGLEPREAVAEIEKWKGTQFCPRVVDAFHSLVEREAFTLEAGEALLQSLPG